MVAEIKVVKETIAVELELSNKNQDRYRRIFWDYAEKKNLWGLWYVVRTSSIARQLQTAAKLAFYGSDGPRLCLSLLEDVLRDPLTAMIYGQGWKAEIPKMWVPSVGFGRAAPVHSGAHAVSRAGEEVVHPESELSCEKNGEPRAS